VFENGVLKEVFGHKGDEVTSEQRRSHDADFHDVCSSPNNIHVIKLRMRWDGQGARMSDRRDAYRILEGEPRQKDATWKKWVWIGI
jgi:hypothetical protein